MNEDQAREIIARHDRAFHEGHADIFDSHKYGKAEGYLEAIHKVRVLEIALDGVLARFWTACVASMGCAVGTGVDRIDRFGK